MKRIVIREAGDPGGVGEGWRSRASSEGGKVRMSVCLKWIAGALKAGGGDEVLDWLSLLSCRLERISLLPVSSLERTEDQSATSMACNLAASGRLGLVDLGSTLNSVLSALEDAAYFRAAANATASAPAPPPTQVIFVLNFGSDPSIATLGFASFGFKSVRISGIVQNNSVYASARLGLHLRQ